MRENYCIQDSLCEEQSKYKRVVRLEEASNEVPQSLTVEGSAGESFNYARADHEHPAIAPTPPTGDSSTKIATTEFVSNVLDELNYASVPDENLVIYKVSQTDGLVSSDLKNISAIKLAGYTVGADNSGKVTASDTLGTALGKLQGQINGMDLAAVSGTGNIITSVSQTDGKVSATKTAIKDIKLTGYQKDGSIVIPIAATDSINNAFSKIENTFDSLEKIASAEDGKVVVTITQSDGQVAEVKEVLKRIKIGGPTSGDGYLKTSETGAIGATDTLNTALSKLENADGGILNEIENNELVTSAALNDLNSRIITINNTIDALDDYDSAESGKFVTDVVQINGKVVESNKSFITKTISADSSVETPTADLVAVVQNSAISFTTDPNLTVTLTSVNVPTKKYVDDLITEAKSSVYRYKGSKENYSNLPSTGNTVGDVWNVVNESTVNGITYPAGTNWAWNGSSWDPLGGQVLVTNNNPTLGTTATVIGTINGHSLTAKIPNIPEGTVTSVAIDATSPIVINNSSAITTSGSRTISHANSGVTAGTYRSVTVNVTGHVTAGTNPTTLAGYGITDASISNGTINIGGNSITPLTSLLWKESTTAGYITPSTSRNSLNGINTIEATTIYQTSDRNMKQNINSISLDDLNKVSSIELKKFEIKNNPGITKYGVIAQEVQDAGLLNLVESNDRILRVDYISLLCLKIAALEEEIKQLKKCIK